MNNKEKYFTFSGLLSLFGSHRFFIYQITKYDLRNSTAVLDSDFFDFLIVHQNRIVGGILAQSGPSNRTVSCHGYVVFPAQVNQRFLGQIGMYFYLKEAKES